MPALAASNALRLRAGAELERRRRQRERERADFLTWLQVVSPTWDWSPPHLQRFAAEGMAIERGDTDRVMFFVPPRHGKSETMTVRFAAYRLEKDPSLRIIICAYGQTLAEKFSRKVRRLVRERGVPLAEDRNTAAEWETTQGGGVRAVGVGSGVTGLGGNLILIDDPVKSREEAESPRMQERVYEWFTDDLYTRLEPGGAILLTNTRWHHADLAGRILESPMGAAWDVVSFPAVAEEADPLGRAPGDALWPARFPAEELARTRETIGEYAFSALYQQRPTPRSGNLFPRAKAQIVDVAPATLRVIRSWDKAGTAGGGKRTAGVKLGLDPDGVVYILDSTIGQWAAAEREAVILQTARMDTPACPIVIEQEPGSGGKDSAMATIANLPGYIVTAKPATGNKALRAEALATQWQAGNVRLVRGLWNKAFLDEMEVAPNGTYVDQMDAAAMGYNTLALGTYPMRPVKVRW